MKNETYKVRISDTAKIMLLEHIAFLSKSSISAAKKLRADFYSIVVSLKTFPYRCPEFETEFAENVYRKFSIGRYMFLYSIDERLKIVNIEYIWDSRRNNML